jgi:cysteine-rich repeat protein
MDPAQVYSVEVMTGATGTISELQIEEFFKVSTIFKYYTGFRTKGKYDCRRAVNTKDNPGRICAQCGDWVESAGEVCDDGNTANGDGCKSDCSGVETGYVCDWNIWGFSTCYIPCGNGKLETAFGEICDDGAIAPGDGCDATC